MNYLTSKIHILTMLMLLIGIGTVLQSCDQPSGITFSDNNNEQGKANFEATPFNSQTLPSLKSNNTLAFDSFEQFGQFMNEFGEAVNIEPDKWVEQKLGFSSSLQRAQNEGRFATESLNGRGTEKSREELVPDPWFASILSEDGLIEVEGTVFQITENYTVIYEDWSAYNSYSNNIDVSANRTVNERNVVKNSELEKVNDSVYLFRIEEHEEEIEYIEPDPGDGGGGSGGDSGGGGSWCCPSERTATYRSGGKDGRLKGKSWDINYGLYSSFGAKSKHQRRGPLGIGWVARSADRIWLDSETEYIYPSRMVGVNNLRARLVADFSGVATWAVDNLIDRVITLPVGDTLFDTLIDLSSNVPINITIAKDTANAVELSASIDVFPPYSHSKSNANTVKVIFDQSTANFGWPVPVTGFATNFEVKFIDSYHKLLHDGHTREFQTRKGSVE